MFSNFSGFQSSLLYPFLDRTTILLISENKRIFILFLFTINKNDQLEFNDETRGHLRNLLVAGILSLKFIEDNLNKKILNLINEIFSTYDVKKDNELNILIYS